MGTMALGMVPIRTGAAAGLLTGTAALTTGLALKMGQVYDQLYVVMYLKSSLISYQCPTQSAKGFGPDKKYQSYHQNDSNDTTYVSVSSIRAK